MFSWQNIRTVLLGLLILLFVIGDFILMHTGKPSAPQAQVSTEAEAGLPPGENFGQYMANHYVLLEPFFEKGRKDVVQHGEVLIFRNLGDILILNMIMSWLISAAIAFGFANWYVPKYASILFAVTYGSWRIGLDIVVFLASSVGALGWESIGSPIPVWILLLFFLFVEVIIQSVLYSTIYHTSATVATGFSFALLLVLLLIGAVVFGSVIKKRVSVLLAEFVDVEAIAADIRTSTVEAQRELTLMSSDRDAANQAATTAQATLDGIREQEKTLSASFETETHSEPFIYGRIIRIRAQGDLASAKDQITAFIAQFPNGTLINAAKAQLDLINQDIAAQATQKQQDATAAAAARADLIARADQGQVTLEEMRHALIGKTTSDVQYLFGKPTNTAADSWGYDKKMIINPDTNEHVGLTVYFYQGTVQSVTYFYGN